MTNPADTDIECLANARRAGYGELEERLWSIIDRDGLGNVPSDIVGAVALLVHRDKTREAEITRLQAERVPSGSAMERASEAVVGAILKHDGADEEYNIPVSIVHDIKDAVAAALTAAEQSAIERAMQKCDTPESEAWSRDMVYGAEIVRERIRSLLTPQASPNTGGAT